MDGTFLIEESETSKSVSEEVFRYKQKISAYVEKRKKDGSEIEYRWTRDAEVWRIMYPDKVIEEIILGHDASLHRRSYREEDNIHDMISHTGIPIQNINKERRSRKDIEADISRIRSLVKRLDRVADRKEAERLGKMIMGYYHDLKEEQ